MPAWLAIVVQLVYYLDLLGPKQPPCAADSGLGHTLDSEDNFTEVLSESAALQDSVYSLRADVQDLRASEAKVTVDPKWVFAASVLPVGFLALAGLLRGLLRLLCGCCCAARDDGGYGKAELLAARAVASTVC